jgi:hypothetical protein
MTPASINTHKGCSGLVRAADRWSPARSLQRRMRPPPEARTIIFMGSKQVLASTRLPARWSARLA